MGAENLVSLTRPAGADLSAAQYLFGKLNSSGQVIKASVEGEFAPFVIQNTPAAAGRAATCSYGGVSLVKFGASVTAGASVMTDANGKAKTAAGTGRVLGIALETRGTNEIGPVFLTGGPNIESAILYTDTAITANELKALYTTPKTLVAAPGSTSTVIPVGLYMFLDYGTTAYDGIAAGEDLALKYTDGNGTAVITVEATGFLDATADAQRYQSIPATLITPVANAPLVLHMLTGNIATGDSPLRVRTYYMVVDTDIA